MERVKKNRKKALSKVTSRRHRKILRAVHTVKERGQSTLLAYRKALK